MEQKILKTEERSGWNPRLRNLFWMMLPLVCAAMLCLLLRRMADGDIYVSMIFLLAVAVVARMTDGYVHGIVASVIGVICVNYAFTYPYFEFCLSISGYPLAFFCMLAVSIATSTMTSQIKQQDAQRFRAQLEQMRANLLRAVSHDLRSPLTSISGAASVLVERPEMSVEARERLLKEIIDDSQWLVRMVENLLSITRINGTPSDFRKSPEAAEEVIAETVRKFCKRFPDMPVEIVLPDEFLLVPMDPILIEQVLINLLENAATHAQTATRICVTLSREAEYAQFEVRDNGAGIPLRKLPVIFDSAAGATSDGSRGMGIGLSVCKAIILVHGGEIEAENNKDGGAAFRFRLPMEEIGHEPADGYFDC